MPVRSTVRYKDLSIADDMDSCSWNYAKNMVIGLAVMVSTGSSGFFVILMHIINLSVGECNRLVFLYFFAAFLASNRLASNRNLQPNFHSVALYFLITF